MLSTWHNGCLKSDFKLTELLLSEHPTIKKMSISDDDNKNQININQNKLSTKSSSTYS